MKTPSIKEQQEMIAYELDDLQCLEACVEKGFTIHDWILCKSDVLDFMRGRLIKHIEVQKREEA